MLTVQGNSTSPRVIVLRSNRRSSAPFNVTAFVSCCGRALDRAFLLIRFENGAVRGTRAAELGIVLAARHWPRSRATIGASRVREKRSSVPCHQAAASFRVLPSLALLPSSSGQPLRVPG